ncbi:class I SAM-dependent methyltransferase [Pseudoalteromonas sp. T1lg23B]|uniref:class I SAM-dependent methyltransferase n=1 Tax=Pseudoalteromonas sp. T1lg23B TaxID=2077097 RepID=UPI000CF6338C|nr:class I SAM-dependent methyltransferase [Pseudoalteromonas sp. T1lg23B]
MILDTQWRILTVGDGDLSFSSALASRLKAGLLTASTYDSEQTIRDKYQHHALDLLSTSSAEYLSEFDVTAGESWQRLAKPQYDLAIFQFPLLPAFSDQTEFEQQQYSINTLNRRLLRQFLDNAYRYALDPAGPMLCYITSKDVKPYCEWDLEGTLSLNSKMNYLGQHPFDITQFPGYKIRNVDRDKHVKDTSGTTYVFSAKANPTIQQQLYIPNYLQDNHCSFCRAGPFHSEADTQAHQNSKKHRTMQQHQQHWLRFLASYNS